MNMTRAKVTRFMLPLLVTCSACLPVAWSESIEADAVSDAFRLRVEADYDEARRMLDTELENRPQNARAWFELARLEAYLGVGGRTMDSAEAAIEKALQASPDTALYHCWAARIAVFKGIMEAHCKDAADGKEAARQFKRAVDHAEKAVALDPDDHAARRILTSLYGNNPPELGGDKDLAEKHIALLEKRSPIDGASARCECSHRDSMEERMALWKKIGQEHDTDSRLHENLALEFARAGDIENAGKHADRALELDPGDGRILMDLCRSFALKKELDAGERFGRRYLAHGHPGPPALRAWTTFALAKIQQMNGDKEPAETTLRKAEELDSRVWFTMTPPGEEYFDEPPPAAPGTE